jgi:hypothetical protein
MVRPPPTINLVVDNVSNRLGVEDYFMNRKVMLTDLALNLDAGKILMRMIQFIDDAGRFQEFIPLEHKATLPICHP